MTPAPDQLLEFARRYTDAWCGQDPARVAENYAPDGSLTINDGAPSVGRAAITEAARSFMVAFPDMQVLMDELIAQDESAEYRWTPEAMSSRSASCSMKWRQACSRFAETAQGLFSMPF